MIDAIDANTVRRFLQDWKDVLALGVSAAALLISLWNGIRDRNRYRLQRPQFKFFVRIEPYHDMEAADRARTAVFKGERDAVIRESFNWALHVRATNEGLQPVTIEYCACEISSIGASNPKRYGADHSEVVTQASSCKLNTGDMHEWLLKFKSFPYRILRIYIFNLFGYTACVEDGMIVDLHRNTVHQWPHSDARLSLAPRWLSVFFLRRYQRQFKPTRISKSEVSKLPGES